MEILLVHGKFGKLCNTSFPFNFLKVIVLDAVGGSFHFIANFTICYREDCTYLSGSIVGSFPVNPTPLPPTRLVFRLI